MLRNNVTEALSYTYISPYLCNCVTVYKYINNNKGLAGYTGGYTSVTQRLQRLHCVTGEALT
jgi:hypothetical protein